MKKISVITINFNNAGGLKKTLKSVIEQAGVDFELIVVDGGSTDESVDIITAAQGKITKWVSEKDKGIYHAQNKGIMMASGEYCLFLNSGDMLADPGVLNLLAGKLKNTGIVYGDLITLDLKGKRNYLNSEPVIDVYQMMISTLWHPTAFIRRELFSNYGLYNEDLKIAGDYEFFIRTILKHGVSTQYVPIAISLFDLGGVSNSAELNTLQTAERKKSWQLNFSDPVIELFENKVNSLRSREYRIGKLFTRYFKTFLNNR